MLELLYTTSVILLFLIGFIYLFATFKVINTFLNICQFAFAFILIYKKLYKGHVLLEDNLFTYSHIKNFEAITDLEPKYENGVFKYLTVNYEYNNSYSSINLSEYSNECLYNYFISYSICPITDIIIENEKNEKYKNYTEIKINDNKYLYYTRNKKDGKLYKYTHDIVYENDLNFVSDFDFNKAYKIKIVDKDKSNNLFTNFKNIINYVDLLILELICYYIISFSIFLEHFSNRIFDFSKFFNMIYELGIFIFYIIRYSEFVKFKNFLFAKEDIYKDKGIYDYEENFYFPNKNFNLDSFPVAISINILIIRLIYIIIPEEWHICLKECNNENRCCKNSKKIFLNSSLYIYTIFLVHLSIFEFGSFGYYDNLMYNWNTNPIKSIEFSHKKDYEFARIKTKKKEYKFYKWRDNYFKIEKLKKYNYFNIYKNENGKICGKDNYGNDLYFPNDIECPINDIIIDNSNMNYKDYKEIKLANSKSLYYTNKKISNKIIIDLKANPYNYSLNLNLKKSNEFCSYLEEYIDELVDKCKEYDYYGINSYIIIDNWNYNSFLLDSLPSSKIINEELPLLGITYFGFDPSTIKERKKIQTIKSNFLAFISFYILILIFFALSFCSGIISYYNEKFNSSFIIFLILVLFQIIMHLISLIIRKNYIHNFFFKIIYNNENYDIWYSIVIYYYIINILTLSAFFINLIYFKIKKNFNLDSIRIEINRNKNKNLIRKKHKKKYNLNSERLNINKQIEHDNNNNRNKIRQKKNIESSQPLIINKNNVIYNNINEPKERNECAEPLNINKKKEINNNIYKPKERKVCLDLININKKNENEDNEIKFIERIEPLKINIINNKNEINNNINKQIERIEYPELLNANKKNEIEDDKIKLQNSESISDLCIRCYEKPIQVTLYPCAHKCLCLECYNREKENLKKCPICNNEIKLIVNSMI